MASDIGVYGLGVMGENLALNFASKGIATSVYNRSPDKVDACLKRASAEKCDGYMKGFKEPAEFVASLKQPRKVVLMLTAGGAVDAVLKSISPLLAEGDIVIDCGNEWYENTERRERELAPKGLSYVGMGVSGGEFGARNGPSLMPGCSEEVYRELEPFLTKIADHAGAANEACVAQFTGSGAGNYVKMVHNGIEYGDMQLISEAYDILKYYGLSNEEMSNVFKEWNESELESYLIEITSLILVKTDKDQEGLEPQSGYLLDKILDCTHNKGTGMWTVQSAAAEQVGVPTISDALWMRYLSEHKQERVAASAVLRAPVFNPSSIARDQLIQDVRNALYCSKICCYAQGLNLIREAAKKHKWTIPLGQCARIWRGGCIIRAKFLDRITKAYERIADLASLLVDPDFARELNEKQDSWRRVVTLSIAAGYTMPAMSASLAYFDSYRRSRLPHNLLQAQRDFFGSHKFERVDKPAGEFYHCKWTPSHA